MEIVTTDYHTAGEPFRIVRAGAPDLPGATVAERRVRAASSEAAERVRRLLCHEPRGHADMYGGFIVPPDDDGADLGVLFWHKDGYSTACGHGTIALGAGARWRNDSVVGTTFHARVTGRVPEGVLTEVEGTAFRTGEHRFVLDPRDPVGTGFVLR